MFCIIAYLALVKLMFFFLRLITLLSFTLKLPPERAEALIMKPLLFWYLGKNRKKRTCQLSHSIALSSNRIRSGLFFILFLFLYKSKKSWSTCFYLTVFYSQGCSAFKASSSRSCVFSRQRSLIFVSFIDASFFAIFLLVTFQYKKLYKKKPHNKPNFILCGWCVGNKFKK